MSTATALVAAETARPATSSRWIELVSHLEPRYGGLSAAVPALSAAIARIGNQAGREIFLAAFCAPGEEFRPPEVAAKSLSFWPSSRKAWLFDKRLRSAFEQQVRSVDGLHLHGLWEQSTLWAARLARRLGKPYVLSAHGMLEPWALGQKRLKKLLYTHLLERANVDGAGCLHALTLAEAAQYRAFGARGPIAIIPNGVSIPEGATADLFINRFPALAGRRLVLYLGRLHEKKGLDLLLGAWAEIAGAHPDAYLVFAGPDADGTRARLEAEIVGTGLDQSVLFTGMLDAVAKWSALAAATGFVLPSHSEGLSVGVLEAMGMGLPVVVTESCNMPQVAAHDAGWVIPTSREALVAAILSLLGNSAATNQTVGARGAALVRTQYSWPVVARQMGEVYGWLEGNAPKPQGMPFLDRGESCR